MALSAQAASAQKTLVFYGDSHLTPGFWEPLFSTVHAEMAAENLDGEARLVLADQVKAGEEFSGLVQVRLVGRCDVVQQAARTLAPGPLGWVLKVQGTIQPYIYIDCTRMAQTLNPTTLGMSHAERARAMAQAIAHVLVHECIHIETQNAGHTEHGITQAQLTPGELVASETRTSGSGLGLGAEN